MINLKDVISKIEEKYPSNGSIWIAANYRVKDLLKDLKQIYCDIEDINPDSQIDAEIEEN